jgi:SAM-dependent methyltransferase
MKTKTVVFTVLGLGVGIVTGMVLTPSHAAELSQVQAEADAAAADAQTLVESREQAGRKLAELKRNNESLARKNKTLENQAAALQKTYEELQAAHAAAQASQEPEDTDDGKAPIPFPEWDEALALADWNKDVGENMSAMVPLISEIAKALDGGGTRPAEAVGNLQRHNGPLVAFGMKLNQHGVPGTGVNGSITHPPVMVNAIAATLEAVGLPLDAAQLADLARISKTFAQRDKLRLADYDERTFALRKLVEEAKLKRTFFDEALAVLKADQLAAISPETTRGRVGADLFSEALLWAGRGSRMVFTDRAQLAEAMQDRTSRRLGLDPDTLDAANKVVLDWAESFPDSVLRVEIDALDKEGMYKSDRVAASAEQMLRLLENLVNDADLPEGKAAAVRSVGKTKVFYLATDG